MHSFFDARKFNTEKELFKTAIIKNYCCGLMHSMLERIPMPRAKFTIEVELEDEDSCRGCPILITVFDLYACPLYGQDKDGSYTRPDSCKANDRKKTQKPAMDAP